MPGTREGMYAGPRACPAASRPWGRHNRTRTPSRGVTLPRRPDYRRAVTRVKDACGAGQAGRAEARSLTRASRAHEQAAARERDTRGQFTMPRKPLCGRETAGRNPLDTGPLLQGCTFTRIFPPVPVALQSQSRLMLEGRARTLSGPSPDLSPAGDSCAFRPLGPGPWACAASRVPIFLVIQLCRVDNSFVVPGC